MAPQTGLSHQAELMHLVHFLLPGVSSCFSSTVYEIYIISETQHVLFVFLSLQRPDQ